MRKSQARTGVRPWRVGVATAATAAAVVAGTATAAFAGDDALTAAQTIVPTQGGMVLSLTGTNTLTTAYAEFVSGSSVTCNAVYQATSSTVVDGGAVTVSSSSLATINTPPLTAGTWKVCLYVGQTTGASASAIAGHTTNNVTAVPFGTLSQVTGPAAGGNTITLTATNGFTGTTFGVEFNTSVCPDKYTTVSTGTIISATGAKTGSNTMNITVPTTLTAATGYYVCVYSGTAASTSPLVARTWTTYGAYATTLPTVTLAPTNGSSGTAGYITVTAPSGTFPNSTTIGATFARNSCPATYALGSSAEPFSGLPVTYISSSKVAVTVPVDVVVGLRDATTPWNVCLYTDASASSPLITMPAVYTVAPVLNVTVSSTDAAVAPTGGPAAGGTSVTITGLQGIPTADGALLRASLGGSDLVNVRALSSTSITGTTTSHAPGGVTLSVTTAAGTKTTTGNNEFYYSYAINVTPNTAAPVSANATTGLPTLDITGAGFSSLIFEDLPAPSGANTKAHVVLVDNSWFNQSVGGATLTATGLANPFATAGGAVPPVTQCRGVLQIGDNELICTLDLGKIITGNATYTSIVMNSGTAVGAGTYSIVVINNGGSAPLLNTSYNYSVLSSGSTFTVSTF